MTTNRNDRIREVVKRLNEIAQERKKKLDRIWLKSKRLKEPDREIIACLDELWELENETEPLRMELVKLVSDERNIK